jgi:hypothetical protein
MTISMTSFPDPAPTLAPSLPTLMQQMASRVITTLDAAQGLRRAEPPVPPAHDPALLWQNTLFSGPLLRRGHVELFDHGGHFAVVHVCLLPHLNDPSPIFGFDMIGGHAQATGIFLDFSPTIAGKSFTLGGIIPPHLRARFAHQRQRPSWGTIFSDHFFAIRPGSPSEIGEALDLAEGALNYYLASLAFATRMDFPCAMNGQAEYANAQRHNPHTQKMLARHVGPEAAHEFMHNTLFPSPS